VGIDEQFQSIAKKGMVINDGNIYFLLVFHAYRGMEIIIRVPFSLEELVTTSPLMDLILEKML